MINVERGMIVKLKPIDKIYERRNWIIPSMREYFGTVVTITCTRSDDEAFTIREDNDCYVYSKHWIDFIVDDVSIK